jgi:hypothetical protein
MDKNDLEALKASFRGVKSTSARLQELEGAFDALSDQNPPTELVRAAAAHAIAATAFSGLLRRIFGPEKAGSLETEN